MDFKSVGVQSAAMCLANKAQGDRFNPKTAMLHAAEVASYDNIVKKQLHSMNSVVSMFSVISASERDMLMKAVSLTVSDQVLRRLGPFPNVPVKDSVVGAVAAVLAETYIVPKI